MARRIFSIIGGLLAGGIVVYLIEMLSSFVYPLPAEIDTGDIESMNAFIAQLPVGAFLFILLAWALGSFAGGLVAGIIHPDQRIRFALVVGVILMLFGLINLLTIPHPLWFWIAGLAVYIPAAYAGGILSSIMDKS
ncbi:MAG: hypothetical protein KQI35_01595 [Bacteroidetes bacterium]|nr:hypothetical protein [Bacteroidota bacterium]